MRSTSRAYTLKRLKHERPDLFERVIAKELSAYAGGDSSGRQHRKSADVGMRCKRKGRSDPRITDSHDEFLATRLVILLGRFWSCKSASKRRSNAKANFSVIPTGRQAFANYRPVPNTRVHVIYEYSSRPHHFANDHSAGLLKRKNIAYWSILPEETFWHTAFHGDTIYRSTPQQGSR